MYVNSPFYLNNGHESIQIECFLKFTKNSIDILSLPLPEIHDYIYLSEVLSTNDYATHYVSNSNPKGNYCIYTFNQLSGKGQIGRYWFSDSHSNITCSYIHYPDSLAAQEQFYLSMAFALAVREFVISQLPASFKSQVKIKWPNDIYINDKKVAGLLIQTAIQGRSIEKSILGAGININQADFPSALPNPTSLLLESGTTYDLEELQKALSTHVMREMHQLSLYRNSLRKRYLEALYAKDILRTFKINEKIVSGIIRDITTAGKLILEIDKVLHNYALREIEYVFSLET